MSKNRDHVQPASEDYVSKVLRQDNDQTLSAARDVLKRKILHSTLQRTIRDLGSPEAIAEMALAEWSERDEVFQRAQGIIRERLIDRVVRRSTESLGDAEAVAGEAATRVDERDEAVLNAQNALKARLIDGIARRSAEELGEAEVVAEQAMGRLYEMQGLDGELDALAHARSATRNRLIGMVARRSVEDLGDAESTAEQAMKRIDERSASIAEATSAVKERLMEAIIRHSADEMSDAEATAEQAMGRLYENNEAISNARNLLKERLLSAILEQTLQEINDEVALSGGDYAGLLSGDVAEPETGEGETSEEVALDAEMETSDEAPASEEEPAEPVSAAPEEEPAYEGAEVGDGMPEQEATSGGDAEEATGEAVHRYNYNYEGDYYEEEPEAASGDGHAVEEVYFGDEEGVDAAGLAEEDPAPAPAFDGGYALDGEPTSEEASVAGDEAAVAEFDRPEVAPMVFSPSPERDVERAEAPIFYVYGVVASEEAFPAEVLPTAGLDEAYAPYVVRHGDLHLILSKLSTSAFSTEALQANLKDKSWKSEYKSRHYRVLDGVMAAGYDVVPMPFGTIYSDEQRVEEMLSGRRGYLEEVLRRLEGRREWNLKIHRDADRLSEIVQHNSDVDSFISELPALIANGFKEGMTSSADEDSRVILENCTSYSHQTLRTFADENVLKTIQVDGGEEEGWMIMEAVYLVHEDKQQAFQGALNRLEAKYAGIGFSYEVTGPRAPLSFCE